MYIQLFLVLKPQVWGKKPRFEHIKKEKISMKVNLFSKKKCDINVVKNKNKYNKYK